MKLDQKTIEAMTNAGIGLYADIRSVGGSETVVLKPSQVQKFISNPTQFAADYKGVSVSTYLQWLETDGHPRCGATTANGTRCENNVSGGIQRTIEDWVELDGGYCWRHGGAGSKEAKSERWAKTR